MKRILYFFTALSFVACNTKAPQPTQGYTTTPTGLQGIQKPASMAATPASSQNQGNVLLNPKHGEPGHRCDLAVGAPLNSAPAKTATTVAQPTVTPQSTAVATTQPAQTATVNTKGQKLNPAHGQPNHRCDIAIGAPLDSKPQPTAAKAIDVKLPNNTPQEAKNGAKLNPAHGQPSHRCDLAVGAPLT